MWDLDSSGRPSPTCRIQGQKQKHQRIISNEGLTLNKGHLLEIREPEKSVSVPYIKMCGWPVIETHIGNYGIYDDVGTSPDEDKCMWKEHILQDGI
jgi:hypothetical protein